MAGFERMRVDPCGIRQSSMRCQRQSPPFAAARAGSAKTSALRTQPPAHKSSTGVNAVASSLQKQLQAALQKAGHLAAAAALSAALLVGCAPVPRAAAITNEQLLYLEAWRAVDRAYYDKEYNGQNWFKVRDDVLKKGKLNSREDTYEAIRSSLALLDDPFTRLIAPDRYAALKRGTRGGKITGVGLEVAFAEGQGTASELVVVTPAPGGPAEQAGIKPGDVIAAIDGKPTKGISLYEAADLLQGAEGSEVQLKLRDGKALRDVPVTRQQIAVQPVSFQMCGGSGERERAAYLRVATFSKTTSESVRDALKSLQGSGASRYILDLRNNGGGFFPASVEVARMLIARGDVVLIADNGGVRDIYDAYNEAIEPTAPLVVLINQGTASAAEVLAGALKDNARGELVGETTFGKGKIQTVVELSDGSAVTVSVARYQTPSGNDINLRGITPNRPEDLGALPFDPPGFCAALQRPNAPRLFGGA